MSAEKYEDPRGPLRKIVEVKPDDPGEGTPVVLDCGHTRYFATHYTYLVGEEHHCFRCRNQPH